MSPDVSALRIAEHDRMTAALTDDVPPLPDEPPEDVEDYPPEPVLPVTHPQGRETGNARSSRGDPLPGNARETRETPRYADIGAILDGATFEAPAPTFGRCTDGVGLFYGGQVNGLIGWPDSGKSWVGLATTSAGLGDGLRVAIVDMDHMGPVATVSRLLTLDAPEDALRDLNRFRYAEPLDGLELDAVVADLVAWGADLVIVDSVGEMLPLFGASSNSPDDYTRVHARILKPLAASGACVVTVDHLAKSPESRAMGATGTDAKRRAIGGTLLRVTTLEAFTPGHGGKCSLTIVKDRHGGLRAHRPIGDKEPLAGTFLLTPDEDTPWRIVAASASDRNPAEAVTVEDVDAIAALDPPPQTVRDARERLGWRMDRATRAMREWRRYRVSGPLPPVTGNAESGTVCPIHNAPVVPRIGCARCVAEAQGIAL